MASSNGLINDFADVNSESKVPQATSTSVNAPAQATTTSGTATLGAVDTNQTVQGRLKGIVDENSPLNQQAQTQGVQQAAARGLVNSSLAVTAGQDALYKNALPIAQQDASTYAQQSRVNQDAQNQLEAQRVTESNQNARFNTSETNAGGKFNADAANAAALANARLQAEARSQSSAQQATAQQQQSKQAADLVLQQLDATTRTGLANIEANYKTLMQSSQSASDLYQQVVQAIGTIQNNKDLTAEARNTLIGQQTSLLQSGLNLIGNINNLNLAGLLDFSSVNNALPVPAPAPAAPPPGPEPVPGSQDTHG